jgi:hypothetical protein
MYLTMSVRSTRSNRAALAVSSRRASLTGALCLAMLNPLAASGAESKEINYYKLYAHSRLIDDKQYRCIDELYTHESNWNPHSRNGKHYGIPQLANAKIRYLDAYSQIDWGIRYIKSRYKTPCKALDHWRRYSWH